MKLYCILTYLFNQCRVYSRSKNIKVDNYTAKNIILFDLKKEINNCLKNQLNQAVLNLPIYPNIHVWSKPWNRMERNTNGRWLDFWIYQDLWYMLRTLTKDESGKRKAIKRTEVFEDFKTINEHHDIGYDFPPMVMEYVWDKKGSTTFLSKICWTLASRFNPKVGNY